ncbi:uncharacterized protein FYW23_015918, partial [Sylvia borin]
PERGLSRKHLLEGLRGSLRRLQLDYVDVIFAGPRPGPAHNEGLDPTLRLLRLEELVRAMSDVIEQGLALYWGTAGAAPGDVMDTFAVARQLNLVAPVCQWAELPPEPRLFRHLGLAPLSGGSGGAAAAGREIGVLRGTAGHRVVPAAGGRQLGARGRSDPPRPPGADPGPADFGQISGESGGSRPPRAAFGVLPRLGPAALRELQPLLGGVAPP